MAEEDIYGNKFRYERLRGNINQFALPPSNREYNQGRKPTGQYFCRNPENLKYFEELCAACEAQDLSYVRRMRLINSLLIICYATEKDLASCNREDVNKMLVLMHEHSKSVESKKTFIKNLKYIWRKLFPEIDERGRPDETVTPYAVRHISGKIDKSREKLRKDKISWEEFERIIEYFSKDARVQAYLSLALESLARPQELLYIKLDGVELSSNYAKLFISEHGKEGVGLLQCIDSYPYLLKWLEQHPLKKDKNSFLFVNIGNLKRNQQLKPGNINKMLRQACKDLGINKPITCYSLKRNGVTLRRLRGESDVEIQHAARWTSINQLKTYDLSSQDEAFKIALQKRGMLENDKTIKANFETKQCHYCNELIGFSETVCPKCRHIVSRSGIIADMKKDEEILRLRQQLADTDNLKKQIMQDLMKEIQAAKAANLFS